jgi:aminomethyltransferase
VGADIITLPPVVVVEGKERKMNHKLVKSPLHHWHIDHGGTLIWDDYYPWVWTHGPDSMEEYEAVRNGVGLLDLFSLFVYEVKGPEADKFIQRTFTNLVYTMEEGQVRYGPFVDEKGIMMDEGCVYKFGQQDYLIIANGPGIQGQMRHYAKDLDAEIENITDRRATIGVQGPKSLETLQSLVDQDISDLKFFRFKTGLTVAGKKCWISRTGYSGEKGYEVNVDAKDALHVWEALVEKGGVPFGVEAIEILRVEAGLMLIYIDYRLNDMSPWDLSMDMSIKLHPDTVGTKALEEYKKVLPRRFKTIKIEGEDLPEHLSGVFVDGEPVGLIKSPVKSPICGVIALAVMDTPYGEDGTKVEVIINGKHVPAEVGPLSIFDPDKKKLRG